MISTSREVDSQYDDENVLRRTTVIQKKRPDGTTSSRKHREYIPPTSPKYINNHSEAEQTMKNKNKNKYVRKGIPQQIAFTDITQIDTTRVSKEKSSSSGRNRQRPIRNIGRK